jgi:DNA-binding response OmpR family regulator
VRKILLVDDEDDLRQLMREVLEMNGYSVDDAGTYEEALEKIGTGRYDLVLLDINLAERSGFEVLSRVKQDAPETKVVMLTGRTGVDAAIRSARSGADDYLAKPISVEYLLNSMHSLLKEETE